MVGRIKAKPTKCCGVKFRSQLEAKYTTLFNMFDEPWTYESRFFKLPTANYLPDFFLPRLGTWVEIKGVEPNAREIKLCEELCKTTGQPVAIAYGWPPFGLRLICLTDWHKNLSWGLRNGKLTICDPQAESLPMSIFGSIDEKFKKRIRTSPSKKRQVSHLSRPRQREQRS